MPEERDQERSIGSAQYLGRYLVLTELGYGAHGSVSKAYDGKLERNVAIKRLKIANLDHKWVKKEARSLAKLSHPHIVSIYEFLEIEGNSYLILEYADGPCLSELLDKRRLDFSELIEMGAELSAALAYSHKLGVLHGDLKPANIILTPNQGVKLVDFGLSKLQGDTDPASTIAPSSVEVEPLEGTLAYTAPEVIMGANYDGRSDIFALGCTLFEALSGERAFSAPSGAATLNAILNSQPQLPNNVCDQTPAWLTDLILDMLEKRPERRIGTMDQVFEVFAANSIKIESAPIMLRPARHQGLPGRIFSKWRYLAPTLLVIGTSGMIPGDTERSEPAPLSVSERMNIAFEHVLNFTAVGSIRQAQTIYSSILSENPTHAGATAGLAISLIREYTSQESDPATLRRATSLANAALEHDPHLALSHIAAGWAAEFNGDLGGALKHYHDAETLGRDNILCIEGKARSLKKLGRFEEAEAELRLGLETLSESANLLNELGDVLIRRAAYSEAEQVFRRSISVDPDNPYSYANVAQALHLLGRTDTAIKVIQKGLEIVADKNLYNNLGTYLYFEGRYEEAASAFERVLELEGNSHGYIYWANLADAYRQIPSKQADANRAYRRAIQIISSETIRQEESLRIHSRLALYAAKSANMELALSNLNHVIGKLDGRPAEYYRVAMTWEILGRRQEAIKALKEAIALGYPVSEIENEPEFALLRQDIEYQMFMLEGEVK